MTYYIIPARKGSKGFPGKNRILFDYTSKQLDGIYPDHTILSTDDEILIAKGKKKNIQLIGEKKN